MDDAIYNSNGVFIDRNVMRTYDSTYSIASIGSVSIKTAPTVMGNIFMTLTFIGGIWSYQTIGWFSLIFVVFFCLAASRHKYEVRIKNSSGDQPVFTTKDKDEADAIKSGIERALAAR